MNEAVSAPPPGEDPAGHRRTYRGEPVVERRAGRRARLLDAGLELFTSRGYQATRVEQLCAHAGVSTRNFYEEFPGKEDLLLALHQRVNSTANQQVAAVLRAYPRDDAVTRIGRLVDAFIHSVTSDPRLPRLAYVEAVGVSPALERQHQEWTNRWARFIAGEADRAAESGAVPGRNYQLTAIALVGAITGLLREWQSRTPPYPVADIAAEMRALAFAAIGRKAA